MTSLEELYNQPQRSNGGLSNSIGMDKRIPGLVYLRSTDDDGTVIGQEFLPAWKVLYLEIGTRRSKGETFVNLATYFNEEASKLDWGAAVPRRIVSPGSLSDWFQKIRHPSGVLADFYVAFTKLPNGERIFNQVVAKTRQVNTSKSKSKSKTSFQDDVDLLCLMLSYRDVQISPDVMRTAIDQMHAVKKYFAVTNPPEVEEEEHVTYADPEEMAAEKAEFEQKIQERVESI